MVYISPYRAFVLSLLVAGSQLPVLLRSFCTGQQKQRNKQFSYNNNDYMYPLFFLPASPVEEYANSDAKQDNTFQQNRHRPRTFTFLTHYTSNTSNMNNTRIISTHHGLSSVDYNAHKSDKALDRSTEDRSVVLIPPTKASADCTVDVSTRPVCNNAHELDVNHLLSAKSFQSIHFGGTRNVWRVVEGLDAKMTNNRTVPFALKTLRWTRPFSEQTYELQQREAFALTYLSNTEGVAMIYGYCGTTLMSEWANRDTLSAFLKNTAKRKNAILPLQLLQMAWKLAQGIANMHEKGQHAPNKHTVSFHIVHRDLDASNIMLHKNHEDGTWDVRLDDFNQAIALNRPGCSYQDQLCGEDGRRTDTRSPEECKRGENLTEKVDVWGLGTIFFYILAHARVYNLNTDSPGPARENAVWYRKKVLEGKPPELPKSISSNKDKAVQSLIQAMSMAMNPDAADRPSAQNIANFLIQQLRSYVKNMNYQTKATARRARRKQKLISGSFRYYPKIVQMFGDGHVRRIDKIPTTKVKGTSRKTKRPNAGFSNANQIASTPDLVGSEKGECKKPEWVKYAHPTCNTVHEFAFHSNIVNYAKSRILGSGKTSLASLIYNHPGATNVSEATVLRLFRYDRNFASASFQGQQIDAIILEELSSSDYVIDIRGFCGVSTLNEYVTEGDLRNFLRTNNLTSGERLSFAKDAAQGLAQFHSIDETEVTVMHRDISLNNYAVSMQNGFRLKLHDFNTARFKTSCGFGHSTAKACDGKWKRTPEDCMNRTEHTIASNASLRYKQDVYMWGGIMFLLLSDAHPFSFEPDRRVPNETYLRAHSALKDYPTNTDPGLIIQYLKEGRIPSFPTEVERSNDFALIALKEAIQKAMQPNIYRRPDMKEIANALVKAVANYDLH